MAERPEAEPEDWRVPQRAPMIAAVAIPLGLLGAVALAGHFYGSRIAPARAERVTPFPAPGIETYVHPGARDPHLPPAPHRPDPAIAAAKRAIVRDGMAGWPR